mmetsp:Transcript_27383/g.52144  ORF Transcript_27383/g.52144 Transcript_27383/m.52144 type:complete len:469 (+) Transcript_27383:120-1526(+)
MTNEDEVAADSEGHAKKSLPRETVERCKSEPLCREGGEVAEDQGGPPLGYFATVASRGFHRMAKEELLLRLQPTCLESHNGKLFFSTQLPPGAPEFSEVRSVERMFVCVQRVDRNKTGEKLLPDDKAAAMAKLQQAILTDAQWEACVQWWRRSTGNDTVDDAGAPSPISFRVKVNKSGKHTSHVRTEEIAGRIGMCLKERFPAWKVDLKHGALEVNVHVADDYWVVGLPFLRQAVVGSGHIVNPGLHPTVSWAIARAGGIQSNDVVCDPMCGKAVILIEASRHWPLASYVGVDKEREYLDLALGNFARACPNAHRTLTQGDCTRLPLRDASVDVMLCDLPFGKMHGTVEGNQTLYPKMMCEAARVVRPGGKAVLLTSDSNSDLMESQVGAEGEQFKAGKWALVAKHPVKIGFKMPTHIYLLYRLGLGDEHLQDVVRDLGLKGSGWDVVCAKKSWRKRWLSERPAMESI